MAEHARSKRCPGCHATALVVEGGAIRPVGDTRIYRITADEIFARCECLKMVRWANDVEQRQEAKA